MSDLIFAGESSLNDCPSLSPAVGYQVPGGGTASLCMGPAPALGAGEYQAIFTPITCPGVPVTVTPTDEGGDCGLQIAVPNEVSDAVGIYKLQYAVMLDGRPTSIKSALVSIEPSAWVAQDPTLNHMVTIDRIRTQMRDSIGGSVVPGYEYSVEEIIHSLLRPIEFWNDTPPPNSIKFANPYEFPYTYQWMEATVSNLMRISATWYLRQSKKMTYGGSVTTDDREKYPAYLQLSDRLWQQYVMFVREMKLAIIRNQGVAVLDSAYPVSSFGSYYGRGW